MITLFSLLQFNIYLNGRILSQLKNKSSIILDLIGYNSLQYLINSIFAFPSFKFVYDYLTRANRTL